MSMVTKTIIRQPKSIVQAQVSVPWADVEPKWNATLQRLAADLEIPGFRKGQAPLPMVEQHLSNRLIDEVAKAVMPEFLVQALQGSDVVPIDYPKYQGISLVKGRQLSFTAIVTSRPDVKVGDYRNIKVTRPAAKQVTDEEVNKLVDELFRRWKNTQSKPGVAAVQPASTDVSLGGLASSGSLSFNTSTGSTSSPQASSGQVSSGLVDAQGNPVASQAAGAPDDNFAKAVGAQSLADLKARMRTDLENEAKYNNELDFEELILQEVEKMTTVEVPDILIEDELSRMLVSLQRRVTDMGLLLDDYLKGQGETVESLKDKWHAQAEKNVRMELGLAEVARQENVEISDAELQAEIDKIQDGKLKAQFEQQEPRLHLRHSLRQMRTLDLLKKLIQPDAQPV